MDIKKILWHTDLTEQSKKVMPVLTSLAEKYGASVEVLHVMDNMAYMENVAKFWSKDVHDKLLEQVTEDANATLDEICKHLGDACPMYEKAVREGDPAEQVLAYANEKQVDLIIMAYGEPSDSLSYTPATIAQKVTAGAKVPVLSVPV